jgi:LPXTG-site transpeptidase (sortase) family protein
MHYIRLFWLVLALVLGTAAATPAAAAPEAAKATSNPVRIKIASIKLNQRILSVGLDKNRIPIVPNHDVGWYNLSAQPGAGENIVLWGHVLRFRSAPKTPAPFARVKELKLGDRIVLYDAKGNAFSYELTKQVWVTPDVVEYILPVGHERLTLVSCIGDKVINKGEVIEMTHRLITIAEPVR